MSESSVCVHGLGYIGLPTAAVLAHHDYRVYCYDIDDSVISDLEQRTITSDEPGLESYLAEALDQGSLVPRREIPAADYHLICVPTPLDETSRADLSAVTATAEAVAEVLRENDVVIVESTVPPGTTVDRLKPLLEVGGFEAGRDFGLVYSPETVSPGRVLTELRTNDRLVGGINDRSTAAGVRLYDSFVEGEVHETDATTAEFAKLAQNTYRDVNIALANELAILARNHDINPRDVVRLGNTHPRVDIHRPGPGPGGHCIPIDPLFLCQDEQSETLIQHARRVNDGMVSYVADLVTAHLDDPAGQQIAILGAAYKGDIADARNSPGLRLAEALQTHYGASVRVHDPYVEDAAVDSPRLPEVVRGADALVVTTDHNEYSDLAPEDVRRQMRTLVAIDTKDILEPTDWRAADFAFSGI